jgi:hypothetical protein
MRNPGIPREERVRKAIPSFKLLLHYFDLSAAACIDGVSTRFGSRVTGAITFAESAVWRMVLNSSLALIEFVAHGDEHWSFSRLGTNRLESFFSLVHRQSFEEDRHAVASRIIAKNALSSSVMQELASKIVHRHREKMRGIEIGGFPPLFHEEFAEKMFHSLIQVASMRFN